MCSLWGKGMNLIQKVGGIGLAEAIASCLLTTAVDPQYYCLDPKQYFNVVNGVVYFYDDETQQFLEWGMFFGCSFKYVSISTLRAAIAAYDYNRTDNLSHFTDNCTDIRNHLSPLTKVIER